MKKLLIPFVKNDTAKTYVKTMLFRFLILVTISSCSKDDGQELSPAKFSIDQNAVDFGEVESLIQKDITVTVTNIGEQDLVLKQYTLSGSNASEFSVDANEMEETVQAGKTYEFTITFEPTEVGDKTATLSITSNVGEHKINLSGKAILNPNAIVSIPDANFKASLLAHGDSILGGQISKIDTNDDGEIQVSEAQAYEGAISCRSKDISDLTGIETFINLTKLEAQENQLTTLDVSQNTALKYLYCGTNNLTHLDISHNTTLEELYCADNQLTNIDISQNTNLTELHCADNQLTSIDASKNTNLVRLICGRNLIANLDVSQNTNLTELSCSDNQLANLDISNNINLKRLGIQSSNLTNIDVSQNINLEYLNLDNNQLSVLNVSNNVNMNTLWAQGNALTNIDISQNTALEILYLDGNQLSNLDVSNNLNLKTLWAQSNMLTNIDISQNTSLETVYLTGNQLSSLNVANGNNLAMVKMQAHNNPDLTCIKIDSGFTPPDDNSWKKDATANYSSDCQ